MEKVVEILIFRIQGFGIFQVVVWDFFHQQYVEKKLI